MKDKNGIEINREQTISIIGDFEGVAVNDNGRPLSPYKTEVRSFDGTEIIIVRGTRDGETCLFTYDGFSYEADFLNKGKIKVLNP